MPILFQGLPIPFSQEAEHVGVMRSTGPGSMPAVLSRISAHTRALHAVLPAGLARGHKGNPAASLKVEQLYGLPVLLSGLASLVLSRSELAAIDHHYKVSVEQLLRLYPGTPASFVYLTAGCLPASATLHQRQLCLLGMVARQGSTSILHQWGTYILSNPPPPSRSPSAVPWFIQVKQLCQQYGLPDPLKILQEAPSKGAWKGAVKRQVTMFWGNKLRAEASALPSLSHLRPSHMSISSTSPLITSCARDGAEVRKMTVQLRMASGRYRTCWLRRHWSGDSSGNCRVPGCTLNTPGTLTHLATGQCLGLAATTAAACDYWREYAISRPYLIPLLKSFADGDSATFLAFLLDPGSQAAVISLKQLHGGFVLDKLCHLTRTWLFQHHRARFRALGLWEWLV